MKRILLYAGIGVISFVVSLVGLYIAMPLLQPDEVEMTRRQIDSLASLRSMTDSSDIVLLDTLADAEPLVLLTGEASADLDTLNVIPIEDHPRYAALTDSLTQARAAHQLVASPAAVLRPRIAARDARLCNSCIGRSWNDCAC